MGFSATLAARFKGKTGKEITTESQPKPEKPEKPPADPRKGEREMFVATRDREKTALRQKWEQQAKTEAGVVNPFADQSPITRRIKDLERDYDFETAYQALLQFPKQPGAGGSDEQGAELKRLQEIRGDLEDTESELQKLLNRLLSGE